MPSPGFEGDILTLFLRSGAMSQFIIFILMAFSVISWAIMVERHIVLRRAERETAAFLSRFRAGGGLGELRDDAEHLPHSPAAAIFRAGFRQINMLGNPRVAASGTDRSSPTGLPPRDPIASLERVVLRAAGEEQSRLERLLPFLATTAAACPFIGLFGTVWGIMISFIRIGAMRSASLQVVAPGIAEALIATAVGLFAAVPAVIAYNYFLGRIKDLIADMEDFSLEFLSIAERLHGS
jgi:biopolymer transport protein TolQ